MFKDTCPILDVPLLRDVSLAHNTHLEQHNNATKNNTPNNKIILEKRTTS
jgi:hypothetical protein